jgi:outer membrane receptor protein involved in Fe transport
VQSGLVGNHTRFGLSAYVQDERRLPAPSPSLWEAALIINILTLDSGSKFSPKAGLVWQAHPAISARFSSGKGFRAASMSERFSRLDLFRAKAGTQAESALETAWSHEIGANMRLAP